MTRDNDQDTLRPANVSTSSSQSQRQGTEGQSQSQRQGPADPAESQSRGGAAQPQAPVDPGAPRRTEGPDEHVDDEAPTNFAQRADEAARRLKSPSADKGLEHDADRGQEGNKTQRDQQDKLGTAKDRTPPLQSPQDDLA